MASAEDVVIDPFDAKFERYYSEHLLTSVFEHRELNPGDLFNVSMLESAERSDPAGLLPWPVLMTCRWIVEHALGEEGLFRIPGSRRKVSELIKEMNANPKFNLDPDESPSNVTSLLVQFLMGSQKCGDPLCADQQKAFAKAHTWEAAREVLGLLPAQHKAVLREICLMLREASKPEHAATNLMDPSKLALCLFPNLITGVVTMVENFDIVFEPE